VIGPPDPLGALKTTVEPPLAVVVNPLTLLAGAIALLFTATVSGVRGAKPATKTVMYEPVKALSGYGSLAKGYVVAQAERKRGPLLPVSGWSSIWYLADSARLRRMPSMLATLRCVMDALVLVSRAPSRATTAIDITINVTRISIRVSPASC
jgi:hypothetical protein